MTDSETTDEWKERTEVSLIEAARSDKKSLDANSKGLCTRASISVGNRIQKEKTHACVYIYFLFVSASRSLKENIYHRLVIITNNDRDHVSV